MADRIPSAVCIRGAVHNARWVLVLIIGLLGAKQVAAQHLIDRFMAERLRMKAEHILNDTRPLMPPLSLVRLPSSVDSLLPEPPQKVANSDQPSEPAFVIDQRQVMRRLERSWFQERFNDTKWAFLGAGLYFTPFDTTYTHELRARLQAHFGPPTRTLGDYAPDARPEDLVQFEYWLVVNDSIPVIVSDVDGPFDRGLIVATDQQYRAQLVALRKAVLAPLVESDERAPYVDYFFEDEEQQWYRTGFDGRDFFMEPVRRQRITPGKRPWLDAMQEQRRN